jgi:protein-tyrosine phosphatase
VLVVALLAVAAAILVWDAVKYRFIAKRFGAVIPGRVYRSGQISKWMLDETIAEHGIAVIVDLQGVDPESEDQKYEIAAAERLGVELLRFPLAGDGTGDIARYADAVEAMAESERADRPVLVHCAAGSQRTGGAIASYRLLVRGDSPEVAFSELKRFEWDPESPLVGYLNSHMAELANMLVERGVIESVPDPLPQLPE